MTEPLARFTPSVMSAERLEEIFVGREHLLGSIMRRVEDAATSETRNQTLLIGPRGAGKTHLVALTYHRTCALIDGGARLQVAWLPEDPWTIVSYRHLLSAIAGRLEGAPPVEARGDAAELEARLVARARERGAIVVLAENLDRILHQLGETGQQRLRHLLQHECPMLLIATTTTLDRSLVDQDRPFHGFFTTTRLRPFTAEQGRDMLSAIAASAGDRELVDFLASNKGLGRVKAIAHLAGGQPRLWALLSNALDAGQLDSLTDLLLTRFDDLTPYYQEQLAALSPQQRLIVAELAEADHPLHVGAIADRLELDQRSVAKSVSELVERGWLRPVTTVFADLLDRRRTYYELAEPLARLAFQLKDSRGEPLRLIVDFLKAWFDPDSLASLDPERRLNAYLDAVQREFDSDEVGGVVRRLRELPETRAPSLDVLGRVDDALASAMDGDAGPFMALPTQLRLAVEERLGGRGDVDPVRRLRMVVLTLVLDRMPVEVPWLMAAWGPADSWVYRAEDLVARFPADSLAAGTLCCWLARAGRLAEAEAVFENLTDVRIRYAAGTFLAEGHREAGDYARAERLIGDLRAGIYDEIWDSPQRSAGVTRE